ncbi:hypothetical protein EYF80_012765 [Liparis tanakae]|uniref:Uncharacterized protein n=1 Tax=Liparis tanakae TaxID=230148 RepID=A0A4Z2IFU3_9TELE|nr:hypothetical protein EYF80_012765 [Liparis tanakae]
MALLPESISTSGAAAAANKSSTAPGLQELGLAALASDVPPWGRDHFLCAPLPFLLLDSGLIPLAALCLPTGVSGLLQRLSRVSGPCRSLVWWDYGVKAHLSSWSELWRGTGLNGSCMSSGVGFRGTWEPQEEVPDEDL